ncbi:MAG: hypothetical protein BM556_05235 [Bacteriovorax sp. MedPE-SWde]|nr:MAG: hypothetical protein BM556_05235 [Bacteriovorax sp. MedPE-SWde]
MYNLSEVNHKYGENVHILSNPLSSTLLTKFSSKDVIQPELNHLLHKMYFILLEAVTSHSFPRAHSEVVTRMEEKLESEVLTFDQRVVLVDLARAGIYPAHMCFEILNYILKPEGLRQDHFYVNRKVDENDQVIGVDVSGSKIGGDVDEAIVLLPDPMGATGGSLSFAIDHYKKSVEGQAKKYIAMHLIITPEYIKRMSQDHPEVEIYALRLDRGMSSEKALKAIPGEFPEEERGLSGIQYIIPGAGGVGEILNNSFV